MEELINGRETTTLLVKSADRRWAMKLHTALQISTLRLFTRRPSRSPSTMTCPGAAAPVTARRRLSKDVILLPVFMRLSLHWQVPTYLEGQNASPDLVACCGCPHIRISIVLRLTAVTVHFQTITRLYRFRA